MRESHHAARRRGGRVAACRRVRAAGGRRSAISGHLGLVLRVLAYSAQLLLPSLPRLAFCGLAAGARPCGVAGEGQV